MWHKLLCRTAEGSYGDEAIGFVQVKRCRQICTVKCKVTPEHKVRNKPYDVCVSIDEESRLITAAECLGCAAGSATCKHTLAVVAWLHRRSEEPPPTDTVCYWRRAKLSRVGTLVKSVPIYQCRSRPRKEVMEAQHGSHVPGSFLADVLQKASGSDIDAPLFYHSDCASTNDVSAIYMDHMVSRGIQNGHIQSDEAILGQLSAYLTEEMCAKAEKVTRGQSTSRDWYNLKFGRVTASKALEASRCNTADGSLVCGILGAKFAETSAIAREATGGLRSQRSGRPTEDKGVQLRPATG